MKKIKPLTEGKVKSQVKVYDGEAPKTQAPPPPKPPMRCGEWQVNNKNKVKLKPTEKELERERKQQQLELARNEKRDQLREFCEKGIEELDALNGLWEIFEEPKLRDKLPDFQHTPPAPELKNAMEKLKGRELFPKANQRAKDIITNAKFNNMEKRLGKIKNVRFGIGGYQDCQLGVHFELGGDSWGVTNSRSVWDPTRVKCEEYTQWTEEDRNKQMNDIMRYVSSLLYEAKVDNVNDLKGKPIECTFEGNILKEWRILTEVL